MRSFKNILVVLVAVAWLPLTMHCRLEAVPGLAFLACEPDCSSAPVPDSDCDEPGCCSTEKSPYRTEQVRLTPPPQNLLRLASVTLLDLTSAQPGAARLEQFAVVPPELPRCWQFLFRTATSPRAPSFAS